MLNYSKGDKPRTCCHRESLNRLVELWITVVPPSGPHLCQLSRSFLAGVAGCPRHLCNSQLENWKMVHQIIAHEWAVTKLIVSAICRIIGSVTMLTCNMLLHYYRKCCYIYVWRYAVTYSYHLSTFAHVYTYVLAMVIHITKFWLWCRTGKKQIAARHLVPHGSEDTFNCIQWMQLLMLLAIHHKWSW